MKLKTLTLTAMIAALCAVGAMIKVPGGMGSMALDSAPAFLGAVFLPPVAAGVAAAIGHLISAMTGGSFLGPLHIFIAVEMFIILWGFAKLHNAGRKYSKWIFVVIANGILAPLPFYWLNSPEFFFSIVSVLLMTTLLNVVIAAVVMPILSRAFQRKEAH